MSRSTWTIAVFNSGTTYDSDGTIYRPNETIEITLNSSHVKTVLADGSYAFVSPETKSYNSSLTFIWRELEYDDAIISKIEDYISNGDTVKITTHLSEEYTGKFISLTKTHLIGTEDMFDLETKFDRI